MLPEFLFVAELLVCGLCKGFGYRGIVVTIVRYSFVYFRFSHPPTQATKCTGLAPRAPMQFNVVLLRYRSSGRTPASERVSSPSKWCLGEDSSVLLYTQSTDPSLRAHIYIYIIRVIYLYMYIYAYGLRYRAYSTQVFPQPICTPTGNGRHRPVCLGLSHHSNYTHIA